MKNCLVSEDSRARSLFDRNIGSNVICQRFRERQTHTHTKCTRASRAGTYRELGGREGGAMGYFFCYFYDHKHNFYQKNS